jgi:ribosomal protein L29
VSSQQLEQLQAERNYYRDRVALLRAKLYRWGLGSTARLEELERELARVEQRLREARHAES